MMKALQSWVWRTLHRSGFVLHRREQLDWPDQLRLMPATLARTIIDVGANTGETVQRYRHSHPGATVHAFEAIPELALRLKTRFAHDANVQVQACALSEQAGTQRFFINRKLDTSSLLPQAHSASGESYRDALSAQHCVEVPTDTLDTYCQRTAIAHIDILKLDIQGAELLCLRGAEDLLRNQRIALIYTEVWFLPMYEGQALFGDLAAYLAQFDYLHVADYNVSFASRNGRMQWADAIFVAPALRERALAMLRQAPSA